MYLVALLCLALPLLQAEPPREGFCTPEKYTMALIKPDGDTTTQWTDFSTMTGGFVKPDGTKEMYDVAEDRTYYQYTNGTCKSAGGVIPFHQCIPSGAVYL